MEYAHRNGWPLLSAIVVNKPNVATGAMEPGTLKGFIGAACELGYAVTDQEKFLREQQEAVFAWASGAASTANDVRPNRPPGPAEVSSRAGDRSRS